MCVRMTDIQEFLNDRPVVTISDVLYFYHLHDNENGAMSTELHPDMYSSHVLMCGGCVKANKFIKGHLAMLKVNEEMQGRVKLFSMYFLHWKTSVPQVCSV